MARDFTENSSDSVTFTSLTPTTARSVALWHYLDTTTGTARRWFEFGASATLNEFAYATNGVSLYNVYFDAQAVVGQWTWATPGTGAWHHLAITYSGVPTEDPIVYVDGSTVSVTETSDPSAATAIDVNTQVYYLCNRSLADRAPDGRIAEVARWDRALGVMEVAALAKGYAPSFFPRSLSLYAPLIGRNSPEQNKATGGGPTGVVTGTAVAVHPRILYPAQFWSGGLTPEAPPVEEGTECIPVVFWG